MKKKHTLNNFMSQNAMMHYEDNGKDLFY